MRRLKLAIVGTGIAGNVAAWKLAQHHDVTVFEAKNHIGGHTNTILVDGDNEKVAIDTGFIVFNNRTYPNFSALLATLDVQSQDSSMSFSVQNQKIGLEYNGSNLNSLFAQRRNLLRPSFHRMLRDILRFNRDARQLLAEGDLSTTLADYLASSGYGIEFIDNYLIPMGSAIWSANPRNMELMPATFVARFFHNHGLLDIRNRPQWRVIAGGSHNYVRKLVAGHRHRIRLNSPVQAIKRLADKVIVYTQFCEPEVFDHVVLACHSDQALDLVQDPSVAEQQVLGSIRFQSNEAILHTDASVMPKNRLAWAAWNCHLPNSSADRVAVTYYMNRLQNLQCAAKYFVTLNSREQIKPSAVLQKIHYSHPVFSNLSIAAQARYNEINGADRIWYCGAYWGNGFHEDGVVSALDTVRRIQERTDNAERNIQRAG